MQKDMRIACFSGPRNCSTAHMYSWGNRPDTFVIDEPFYALYLRRNPRAFAAHPMAQEVVNSNSQDYSQVVNMLVGEPLQKGKPLFFQKHMAHHMLEGDDLSWLKQTTPIFLTRAPREVILSLQHKLNNGTVTLQDTGMLDLYRIYKYAHEQLKMPTIHIDAKELLTNPERSLAELCEKIGVPFPMEMLTWPQGPKSFDGIWAPAWYENVWNSTRFEPYKEREGNILPQNEATLEQATELYQMITNEP